MVTQLPLDPARSPADHLSQPGLRELVTALGTCYAGDWDDLVEDVERRRAGKPHLFKLDFAVDGDLLDLVASCRAYEAARGESLASALQEEAL